MQHSFHSDGRHTLDTLWWGGVVALWVACMVLAGGTSLPSRAILSFQAISSAVIAVAALWHLRRGFPTWVSVAGAVLMLAGLGLVGAQLVPLPAAVWTLFPNRELIAEGYLASGNVLPWLPLNLRPADGFATLLAALVPAAAYLVALTLTSRNIVLAVTALLGCALVGVLLALWQRYGAGFTLYSEPERAMAVGTFGNRNFLAAQLFTAIPFVAALATVVAERWNVRPWLTSLFAIVYIGILLAGLAASGSRGGVLLSMLSVFLTFAFVFKWHRLARSGAAVLGVLASLFVIAQASMVGILRLVERDPLEDYRAVILTVAWKGALSFFPAGSGFGSFAPAYQIFERPSDIVDSYVNHAHNDWLELVFEGGLPVLVLMVAFLALFLVAAVRLIRLSAFGHSGAFYRAAAVSALVLMLHAVVDFGLRTPALLTVFAFSLGLLSLPGSWYQTRELHSSPSPVHPQVLPAREGPRPFVPGTFGNRRKKGE